MLPSKRNSFDRILGESAKALKKNYDADYAFFTFVRDAHRSPVDSSFCLRVTGSHTQLEIVSWILERWPSLRARFWC